MRFSPLPIHGARLVETEPVQDGRGQFARTYCAREFAQHGITTPFVQCNVSLTTSRGTIRGMHLQAAPHAEAKLVRCVSGSAYDVMLDLRPDSPTFARWHAVELSARTRNAVYIPAGCAHGFQALEDGCELFYQMSAYYVPEAKRGVRWNDPAFAIQWPLAAGRLSGDDEAFPDFDRERWTRDWGGT